MDEIALLKLYLNPNLIDDIQSAKSESIKIFEQFNKEQTALVSISDVLKFEGNLLAAPEGLVRYLKEIRAMQVELEANFRFFIDVIFQRRKEIVENDKDKIILLGVASQMAEYEAVMYAGECKMLKMMAELIEDRPLQLNHIFSVNQNLIGMLILRMNKYVVENVIRRTEHRRKKLYLLMQRYEGSLRGSFDELAYDFVFLSRDRGTRLSQIEKLLKKCDAITSTIQENLLVYAMSEIEEFVEQTTKQWSAKDKKDYFLYRNHIDAIIFEDIQNGIKKTYNRMYRPDSDTVNAVDPNEILLFERLLLSRGY